MNLKGKQENRQNHSPWKVLQTGKIEPTVEITVKKKKCYRKIME